jgi:hypothetical protein
MRYGDSPRDENGKQLLTQYNNVMLFLNRWYEPYFRSTSYPMAMARLEDLVYRPKEVVTKICECVGGVMRPEFSYRVQTSNLGPGHGSHGESNLLTSFVKYGKPLEEYYEMLSPTDKRVLRISVSNSDGFFGAMGYKLIDD